MVHVFLKPGLQNIDFPGGSDGKESVCNAGDLDPIPGSGRFPGERNGIPLQYFCLENLMERNLASYSPWGLEELGMTDQLTHEVKNYFLARTYHQRLFFPKVMVFKKS